ncbi:hypothetical protein TVAG_444790 [Trichomonas vaginalis G3]|uniref:F5/8 type C domain-containing protein n=1 Tax=Trichomonas vaginalis (strain ATCC PRA-98 / G3) TaxID=412133 RepID=A2FRX7_TRIV3|nr:hypothetical protein TVAGG3_0659640 [Trichomonas vaginalis G3]EAX92343.1 hypothetical protein TVAG_444790 [Trichomonas vaginalis G3]KAI5506405.1 hypothetical protein TVAGG3_0659640 [Trichomonas vaginalis G3]|eukprot:XP_001305273.1 hypothetical protein [Trichomonas vaginalis G3]
MNLVEVYTSGSSKQFINGTLQTTKPEYPINQINKKYDWCSNCGRSYSEHPYAIYTLKNKMMNINGYYLKAGCCGDIESECCCYEDASYCCHCCLYSWSLQISNDNKTWKTIHKVEKDYDLRRCRDKTFKFSEQHTCRYVRLIQDEPCPGDPPCIGLNKIELIGSIEGISDFVSEEIENEEDDVSIIGHISKNNHN